MIYKNMEIRKGIDSQHSNNFQCDIFPLPSKRYFLEMAAEYRDGASGPVWFFFGEEQQTFQYFEVDDVRRMRRPRIDRSGSGVGVGEKCCPSTNFGFTLGINLERG